MIGLPTNFISLHTMEERLRLESIAAVEADEDLMLHLELIEMAMEVCDVLRQLRADDEDLKVIQLFGMRMFNAFASSIKLIMSGYYQKGGMIMRDILETVFLADYFRTDRTAITRWRFADKKERMGSSLAAKSVAPCVHGFLTSGCQAQPNPTNQSGSSCRNAA